MHSSIRATANLLRLNTGLVKIALSDLSNEDALKISGNGNTTITWNLGHILKSRFGMLKMLGTELEYPWPDVFDRGSFFDAEINYPDITEIGKVWMDISEKLHLAIDQLSEEDLKKELPYKYPHNENTVNGVLQFILFHETYHIGKISYIRSSLGYEGLIK